jgi:hypothetical protein
MAKPWIPGRFVVLAVVAVIAFVGISSQITCFQQLFNNANSYTLAVFVPLNAIIMLLLINYTLVCNTDPGAVPINWVSLKIWPSIPFTLRCKN